ncbi:MAG TPA: metallopeptidase family protein [Thermoanaerobaculia bacterium]|nr:metallopeptidase family protein [Thermoanaerobaculia bacterium]
MIDISQSKFDELVEQALGELPDRFKSLIDNVAVVVEEEPSEEDYDLLEDAGNELLGIFRTHPPLPSQIVIFRGSILRIARNHRDAVRQIRETVIHELGHYFGLDDDGMAY